MQFPLCVIGEDHTGEQGALLECLSTIADLTDKPIISFQTTVVPQNAVFKPVRLAISSQLSLHHAKLYLFPLWKYLEYFFVKLLYLILPSQEYTKGALLEFCMCLHFFRVQIEYCSTLHLVLVGGCTVKLASYLISPWCNIKLMACLL